MDNIIRVLHVLGGMNQGGTENFLMNLYRNVNRDKVQFDFLVNRKGIFDEEVIKMGGKIYYIPALQKVGQIKYVKNLDNFFKQHEEYKIVHSHINQVTGLVLERAKKANIPIRIAHSHSSGSSKNIIERSYKKYLGSKILNNATLLIACSDKASEKLFKNASNNALIMNNGIEIDKFRFNSCVRNEIRRELNIKDNDVVVGHVGRFLKVKNHKYLIEIYRKYNKINKNSKLLLVGDGPLRKEIEKKVKNYDLQKNVIFMGNRSDVNKIYQAMDLFIFPSLSEGLPLVLIEAQVAGLNILASKNITSTVNVTGSVKFLDIKEKPEVWVEEILKLNTQERNNQIEKIKEIGYDIKDVAVNYMKLIKKII